MSDHITIRKAVGTWVVRTPGGVLGESSNALEVTEGTMAPVIYFPRDDIGMAFLERSESTTTCPHKGVASYYTVTGPDGDLADAAWSYEDPLEGVKALKGYLAFFGDRATVEQL